MRKNGRHTHDRLRAMRFALWAQQVQPSLITARQISGLLDISIGTARRWRTDYLNAISAKDIAGVPSFLTPAGTPCRKHRS